MVLLSVRVGAASAAFAQPTAMASATKSRATLDFMACLPSVDVGMADRWGRHRVTNRSARTALPGSFEGRKHGGPALADRLPIRTAARRRPGGEACAGRATAEAHRRASALTDDLLVAGKAPQGLRSRIRVASRRRTSAAPGKSRPATAR